jgi:Lrp/AsnC family leucine-responsive transcriptional regulator
MLSVDRDTRHAESKAKLPLHRHNRNTFPGFALMPVLDQHDQKILTLLQENARLTFAEIGRQVHLSSPAVAERVKRLEEAGVIAGYAARVNLRKLGYSFEALVQVTVESHPALDAWVDAHQEVLALHATTGNQCAIMRLALTSPEHLQSLLGSLGKIAKTTTSLVLASTFEDRKRVPGDKLTANSS